jgi:hypothetical protein
MIGCIPSISQFWRVPGESASSRKLLKSEEESRLPVWATLKTPSWLVGKNNYRQIAGGEKQILRSAEESRSVQDDTSVI